MTLAAEHVHASRVDSKLRRDLLLSQNLLVPNFKIFSLVSTIILTSLLLRLLCG
jgi:hypothetical protein